MGKTFCVYMLASSRYGTLYVGVTSDLIKRVWEHRHHFTDRFTKKYNVTRLVWYEVHTDAISAITREKRIKEWKREWKIRLIQQANPTWRDLYDELAP